MATLAEPSCGWRDAQRAMLRITFNTMSLEIISREWLRPLRFAVLLAIGPAFAFAAETPASAALPAAPNSEDVIVSTKPMEIEAEDTGVHGQLVVASEILSPDTQYDLIYTITSEPRFGRVGLAGGGGGEDFFSTKT